MKGIYIDKSSSEAGQTEFSIHGLSIDDLIKYKLSFENRKLKIASQSFEFDTRLIKEEEKILRNAYKLALEDLASEAQFLSEMISRISPLIY